MQAEKTLPKSCILLAEKALLLTSTSGKTRAYKMTFVVFNSVFDAEKLYLYVTEVQDHARILIGKAMTNWKKRFCGR